MRLIEPARQSPYQIAQLTENFTEGTVQSFLF